MSLLFEYMLLTVNTASVSPVGRKGKSLKKNMSVADTSRYLLFGRVDVTACSIALMTRLGLLNPCLHIEAK